MHFFNPVPVLKLVEVIRGRETSDETAEAITELARELGKTPAEANDFPGFVSNRILMPFINEAVWALHDGVAEAEAIDTIAKLGFAHPMGPLALADLIGLDTCVAIMEVLHDGLGDDRYAPCPLLTELVEAGQIGPQDRQPASTSIRSQRPIGLLSRDVEPPIKEGALAPLARRRRSTHFAHCCARRSRLSTSRSTRPQTPPTAQERIARRAPGRDRARRQSCPASTASRSARG